MDDLTPSGSVLWLVTGRRYGADDDSAALVWANSEAQAHECFVRNALALKEEDLADHTDDHPCYYIIQSVLVGTGPLDAFVFSEDARLNMLGLATDCTA